MSDADADARSATALPHAVTKRADDPEARKVWVEMYPGGDAMIELGGIGCDEELYLSSGEPEALMEALRELILRKQTVPESDVAEVNDE